jgi:hypothetical protein
MVNRKSHATPCTARLRCPDGADAARMPRPCEGCRGRGAGARRRRSGDAACSASFTGHDLCAAFSSARATTVLVLETTTETVPHAPPTPPQRDIVRTDIPTHDTRPGTRYIIQRKHPTAVPALLCSVCLAVLRIPTCAPHRATCYQPQTYIAYAHKSGHKAETANPLASAGRRGHPHHSASCEIVHHR